MRGAAFLFLGLLPIIIIFSPLLSSIACADGIRFNGDITYSDSESDVTNKTTGEKINTNFYTVEQRYNLNLSKNIFPYLLFETGTIFEWNNATSKTEGTKNEFEERKLQPFARLRLENPLYRAGLEYRRTEIHEDVTDQPVIEKMRDEFDVLLGWRPLDLPRLDLRYNYLHSYDDPETVDTIEKLLLLRSEYTWRQLRLDYVYTRQDIDNRITNFDTREQTHLGRIEYSHNFWDGRLSMNSRYRLRYNTFEFPGTGSAEVALPRSQGLFSLDSTPQDGPALAPNSALIDGNLTASSGIDIGLGGDEFTLTNIGVDFGLAVDVDTIRIWVDRSLTSPVANSFSWAVFTSPDNTNASTWTLVATVSPADFGTFENRFEIPFPTVTTRFIKVVTTPLSPTVPGASNFPNIFVTEMQAFALVTGVKVDNKITNIDHNYDLNLRARLSDKTVLGYNLILLYRDQDPSSQESTQLTNDIFINHVLNSVFSTGANMSRTDKTENNEDTVSHSYNAFLKGTYLPTFNQTLTFSGRNTKEEDDSDDTFGLILRNNAILYRGWSALLDLGYNYNRPAGSDVVEKSILFRAGTTFEPNQMLTFNMNYQLRNFLEPDQGSNAELNLEAFFVPTRTLSFNARYDVLQRTGFETQTIQNYTATWSPFPDGNLQVFISYNEARRSQLDEKARTIGPGLNWSISRHFFLEMFYNFIKTESNTQEIETYSFFAKLRMTF